MKKRALSLLLCAVLLFSLTSFAMAFSSVLSPQGLMVDGESVTCEKYNIDGSNYFKLRDLAYLLNGTKSQFSVVWNSKENAVEIGLGKSYTPDGSELDVSGGDKSAKTVRSSQSIRINGITRSDLTVYNIGGNNYFKLRELGVALGFDVDYDQASNTAIVRSGIVTALKELNAEQIYEKCAPAVFYVEVYDQNGYPLKNGSGFFIDSNGTAVTNYHVISGAKSAKITASDTGKVYDVAGVYDYNVEEDWAILKISGSGFDFLEYGMPSTVVGGASVYAIGSPLGLQNSISAGIVSNPSRLDGGMKYIQTTASISPGSSGGALINKYGEVVGITSAAYTEGQNLNLAIPVSYIYAAKHGSVTALKDIKNPVQGYVYLDEYDVSFGIDESYYLIVNAFDEFGSNDITVHWEVDDPNILDCAWDEWYGDYIDLYLYPVGVGTTTVTVWLYVTSTEELLDWVSATVTVLPASGSANMNGTVTLSTSSMTLNLFNTGTVTVTADADNTDGCYCSYYIDDPSVVTCKWAENWDGTRINLYLTPQKVGRTTVTVVYYTGDGYFLDSAEMTVNIVR